MSAREAYIAGRSGGRRPPDTSTKVEKEQGFGNREQAAYDAGRQDRENVREQKSVEARKEAAKTMQQAGLSGVGYISSTTKKGQQAVKDYYEDRGEKVPENIQDVLKETPVEDKGIFDAGLDTIQNLWLKSSPTIQAALGLGKGFKTLFGGVAPTIEQLQDPNFLAIMIEVLKGDRKDQFVEDYKDLIAEAGYTDSEDFETALDEAEIPQGSEAQRRLEPWNYYDQDLYETSGEQAKALEGYPEFLTSMGLEPTSSRFAATSGNLEKIAKIPLDSIPYDEQGRKFRRQVLAAREQVGRDRDRRERQSGGGGGGIFPPDPIDPIDPIDPDPTLPDPPPGTTPILPPGTTLTPGPFDYLQWPQFTSAYPGHYANQGIPGQAWPQYDYWNQIAKTFPGMR